ncbi:MAG: hypothetical protein QOF85_1616 [Solirubrobacterales bacterium]|nr:hypothetical protein [Solirubrobacterales bacterium]
MKGAGIGCAVAILFGVIGCGSGGSDTVGVVLEHFCSYEAFSDADESACFTEATEHGFDKVVRREEWGPRAQAVLYALGEVKDCLSRAGSQCERGDWPPVLEHESLLVSRYCAYGASSIAQLHGCVQHVTPSTVRTYRTNAERYAVGDRTTCGYDSGPFCVDHG